MPPPDLSSPEGRLAYRAELSRVARPLRWTGLTAIAAAAVAVWWVRAEGQDVAHTPVGLIAVVVMLLGWLLVALAIAQRTAYHRRRMNGP
jgi:polyferredoxin